MSDLKGQLVSALLVVLTAVAVVCAGINFQQQRQYQAPDDGVTWVERQDPSGKLQVVAFHVVEGGGAERAGIKSGDVLLRINNYPIASAIDATRFLTTLGAWKKADYQVERDGVLIPASVIIREYVRGASLFYQYVVGVCYLAIGLFVYFRRGRAQHATHFYILCLASFVLSTFHYTGSLTTLDRVIYWGNVAAGMVAPTVFLHFCLAFPTPRRVIQGKLRTLLLYTPAILFLLFWLLVARGMIRTPQSPIELRWALDRAWLVFLSSGYLLGTLVVNHSFRHSTDPIVRPQLKWLRNGAALGVLPFTAFYVVPFLFGVVPDQYMPMAVLSLLFVPLTWAWAILRYRLMDVDVIFQQGFAYTLATLAVLGVFYGLVFSIGPFEDLPPQGLVLLILIAAFLFQPLHNWIKEQLDRSVFYKDRYDYRRELVEFGRELGAETDLGTMLHAVAERLHRTLYIKHVAFFTVRESGESEEFELVLYSGDRRRLDEDAPLDLSFLPAKPAGPVFFEQTRHMFDILTKDWTPAVRQTVSRLDLTYYFPCSVRGRVIAWLGVSRTDKGDFLSSEDLELLATVSGYVGIAVENARLYRSLQLKVAEYERLKEFSENIVESINVGIVAAGLDDRVESWNSQMEDLTGVSREKATGQPLQLLFPQALAEAFDQLRGQTGIHQIYKVSLRALPWPSAPAASNGTNGSGHPQPAQERLVNIAIAPLFTKDQQQIGRLVIFDDITERAELEQRLVQADKLSSIGLLAAGVAHEVNTPLAVISTYAQMLTKQISADDPKSKLLEKIAKQTFRASEIVNSLLNFSRTGTSEFEDVDVNRVVRETISMVEHQLTGTGVRVEVSAEDHLPPVRGNSGKMQQVFLNLVLNARDAMDEGGTLKVTTRSYDGGARVEIADTGKGIPAEDLKRIYDPFFTTKGARKGTGLGLAVTYGIVREHNGTIEVISKPGEGTCFQLDFPLARKPQNA